MHLLDAEGSSRDPKYRGSAEEVGEPARVQRGRGHDELQAEPPGQHLLEHAEEHIRVEAPLMRFVHDDCTISIQIGLPQRLPQEHPISQVLDHRVRPRDVLEANRVAHGRSELAAHFLANPSSDGHGSDASRLRACHDHVVLRVAVLVEILRELRRLAAARFPHDDDDLMLPHHAEQVLPHAVHRQVSSLLRDGLGLGKVRHRLALRVHVLLECAAFLVVKVPFLFLLRRRRSRLLVPEPEGIPHSAAAELPEAVPRPHGLLLAQFTLPPHQIRAAPGVDRHVAGGVADRGHQIALTAERHGPFEERRPQLMHLKRHARICGLIQLCSGVGYRYAGRQ
mmetsp:Transcript_12415/g.45918  ORF Transcript_12415/g.45918 Transcript_12415/m.45918 type:complete len:338 (+) Transcript_12415:1294-2307(+)